MMNEFNSFLREGAFNAFILIGIGFLLLQAVIFYEESVLPTIQKIKNYFKK